LALDRHSMTKPETPPDPPPSGLSRSDIHCCKSGEARHVAYVGRDRVANHRGQRFFRWPTPILKTKIERIWEALEACRLVRRQRSRQRRVDEPPSARRQEPSRDGPGWLVPLQSPIYRWICVSIAVTGRPFVIRHVVGIGLKEMVNPIAIHFGQLRRRRDIVKSGV